MTVRWGNHSPGPVIACLATVASLVALPSDLARAQDGAAEGNDVEEIVVTGSRIARRDYTAPSPITTIDRSMLENSGQPTLEATLNQMPQVLPDYGRTSNNPGNGTSRINLRGLGSNRTLVMLNGRRLAPSGVGSSVDINNLPQVLVDRVEIITGGATTVYGSDAVAGVVNFILRDDFDGFGLDASAYTTEKGDSEVYDLNVTYGHNFNGGNITLFATYLDRGESFAGDRSFTEFPWWTNDQGDLFIGGSSAIPAGRIAFPRVDLGNGPVSVSFTPEGLPVEWVFPDDLYNFAPVNYLQVPLERISGGMLLNYEFGNGLETYAELTYTRNTGRQNLAPVPVFSFLATNPDNPVLTPETQQVFTNLIPIGPNLVGYSFRRRMEELGFRIAETEDDYSRAVVGLRGDIGAGWDFDIWATYTKGEEEELQYNDASASRLQQGLLVDPVTGQCFDPADGCVPVDLFGVGRLSPEAQAFIGLPPHLNVTERTQKLVSGYVRGSLFDTWAGSVDVAIGAEWRSDDGSFDADEALFTGDALGFSGDATVIGKETVTEIYAEAVIPLAEDLPFARRITLEAGGRYSEYDKAGSVDSWKLGGEWMPVDGLRFRAMWQRSVRAPDLVEAFQEQYVEGVELVGSDPADDACSASADPVGRGNVEKCVLQGLPLDQVGIFEAQPFFPVDAIRGGNESLTPEKAETATIGVVFTGLDNWTFSVDYFELEVEDTIREPAPNTVCFNTENTTNFLCENMRRDAAFGYNVVEIDYVLQNLGLTRTSGFDTQISFAAGLPDALSIGSSYAEVTIDLTWTHMRENRIQDDPNVVPVECAGYFGFPCNAIRDFAVSTFPENRIMTSMRYLAGNFDAQLNWRWIEGTKNAYPLFTEIVGDPEPVQAIPDVGSKSYFDLGLGYQFSDNIAARLTVANLFDTDPAFMADAVISNNTDTSMYDIFGRSYQLSVSLRY